MIFSEVLTRVLFGPLRGGPGTFAKVFVGLELKERHCFTLYKTQLHYDTFFYSTNSAAAPRAYLRDFFFFSARAQYYIEGKFEACEGGGKLWQQEATHTRAPMIPMCDSSTCFDSWVLGPAPLPPLPQGWRSPARLVYINKDEFGKKKLTWSVFGDNFSQRMRRLPTERCSCVRQSHKAQRHSRVLRVSS